MEEKRKWWEILRKFWEFLMKIDWKIAVLFYFYFGKFVTKNRAFGNKTICTTIFSVSGEGIPPPPFHPLATPLAGLDKSLELSLPYWLEVSALLRLCLKGSVKQLVKRIFIKFAFFSKNLTNLDIQQLCFKSYAKFRKVRLNSLFLCSLLRATDEYI